MPFHRGQPGAVVPLGTTIFRNLGESLLPLRPKQFGRSVAATSAVGRLLRHLGQNASIGCK
jgi:hypothetical protein